MDIIFFITVAIVLAVGALYRGAESRPGFDERPDGSRFGALS